MDFHRTTFAVNFEFVMYVHIVGCTHVRQQYVHYELKIDSKISSMKIRQSTCPFFTYSLFCGEIILEWRGGKMYMHFYISILGLFLMIE